MDEQVLAAMVRWPSVPAAYGWLSLSLRGQWLLHPHGQGWGAAAEEPGELISNPQIAAFMNRNYQSDEQGRWFFQNGPQRVYVRLDGAPWILHTAPDPQGQLLLLTHTGQPYGPISHWWLDDHGRLYAQSGQGAGLIADRDLAQVIDTLRTTDDQPLSAWLEGQAPDRIPADTRVAIRWNTPRCPAAPLGGIQAAATETTLGFVRRPSDASPGAAR